MNSTLRIEQFPGIYDQFAKLLNGKPWLDATRKLKYQITENPLAHERIFMENLVAYGLSYFEKGGIQLEGSDAWPAVLHAISFAAQVCDLVTKAENQKGRQAYLKRINGAFLNPAEIRAIRFENLTALALHRHGASLEWPDAESGPETYDLLVTSTSGLEFEFECKSCSQDKGQPITKQDADAFHHRILKRLLPKPNPGELLFLKIRVPKRLPKNVRELDQLAAAVLNACRESLPITSCGTSVSVHRIPLAIHPGQPLSQSALDTAADSVSGGEEGFRGYVCIDSKASALCVEICSEQAPDIYRAWWRTAKHAVQNQMTGTRPGCLVLRIEGLLKDDFAQLIRDPINPLVEFATKVLDDPRHKHLVAVAYVSDEVMVAVEALTLSAQSKTYVVQRPDNPYRKDILQLILGTHQTTTEKTCRTTS